MPDIHLDPVALRAAAVDYEHSALGMFEEQFNNYKEAHAALSAPRANWFGGEGATGRIQDAGKSFLAWLSTELESVIADKKRVNDGFRQHLSEMTNLANHVQAADEENLDTMNRIARELEGGY